MPFKFPFFLEAYSNFLHAPRSIVLAAPLLASRLCSFASTFNQQFCNLLAVICNCKLSVDFWKTWKQPDRCSHSRRKYLAHDFCTATSPNISIASLVIEVFFSSHSFLAYPLLVAHNP
jgi:hypothetical protein